MGFYATEGLGDAVGPRLEVDEAGDTTRQFATGDYDLRGCAWGLTEADARAAPAAAFANLHQFGPEVFSSCAGSGMIMPPDLG